MISLSSIVKAKYHYIYPGVGDPHDGGQSSSPVPFVDKEREEIIQHARNVAQEILAEARLEAEKILAGAKAESQAIKFEADRLGHKEGYTRGLMDGAKEVREAAEEGLEELEYLANAMRTEWIDAVSRQEKDITLVALEVAKKIMKQHIELNSNAMPKMLGEIVHENSSGVTILLSEYSKVLDLVLDKSTAERLRDVAKNANVRVVITKHDDMLMVETENGTVDMSIPVQLDKLKEALNV